LGVAVIAVIAGPFIALVPAMAIIVLHAGKIGTTWLVTAQGVGAVTGALTLPTVAKRTSRLKVLRGSIYVLAGSLALYAVAPNLASSVAVMVVLGGAYMGTMTGLNTSVQLHAPRAERSRILALYILSLSLFYPLGAFVQSDLAKSFGVRPVTLVAAGTLIFVLVLARVFSPDFWLAMGTPPVQPAILLAD
jgi:predicted MFS family arabinose efflux permease